MLQHIPDALASVVASSVLIVSFLTSTSTVIIETTKTETPKIVLETREQMEEFLKKYSEKMGIPFQPVYNVISCESGWNPKIQSQHIKDGKQEESFGLAQIYLPAHPNVTKEQALDPEFSIKFIVDKFAEGKAYLWTCWRKTKVDT